MIGYCTPMTYGEYMNSPHFAESLGFVVDQPNGLRGWVMVGFNPRRCCIDCGK